MDESVKDVQKWLKQWQEKAADWRTEAEESYGIVAGDQWQDTDVEAHEEAKRPVVAFNRVSALIRGVCGLEVNNRQEVRYVPREIGDVKVNELLTAAAEWVRDECNAEDEESEAFRDLVISGMAFIETWVDYSNNPAGEVVVERRDPLSCAWDTAATKRGLQDARWLATWKDLEPSEVERHWPGAMDKIGDTEPTMEDILGSDITPHENDEAPWYNSGAASGDSRLPKKVRVVQVQYWKDVPFYRVFGMNGQTLDIPPDKFEQAKPMIEGRGLQVRKIKGREYRQRFVAGAVELADEKLPTDRFTLTVMTGVRDRNKNIWYGLVRDLKDPQKWTNKFFSLMVDILATNAKGGLLAEQGAFMDDRQAEKDWSDPRAVVWLKSGGLAKVKDRTSNSIPPAMAQLMDMANNMVPQTSGVSLEFLGLTDKVQPGVLEYQRRQSTIGTLAEFFSSLRLYRKNQGRVLAKMIKEYLNDGRLVRIAGQDREQYVPLLLQPGAIEFDVVVDESPTSPDIKGRTWAALGEVLPLALKVGLPIPPEVFDYSPMPSTLATKWKEMLQQATAGPQIPPEMQQQVEQMGQEMQQLAMENQQLKQDKSERMAELEYKRQEALMKMQMEAEGTTAKLQLQEQLAAFDRQMKLEEMTFNQQIQAKELALKAQAQQDQLALKVMESDINTAQAQEMHNARVQDITIKREEQRLKSEDTGKASDDLKALMKELKAMLAEDKTEEKDDGPVSFTFTYDKAGRVTGATGGKKSVSFSRDKSGRVKGAKVTKTGTGD